MQTIDASDYCTSPLKNKNHVSQLRLAQQRSINEIFDYGRPASIILAILIERSGRELPVHADIIGKTITLKEGEHVKLSGPEPLALEIKKTG